MEHDMTDVIETQIRKRKITNVFSTAQIQPLRSSYFEGDLLQLIFQESKSFVDIGECELIARLVISYPSDGGQFDALATKLMAPLTPICAQDLVVLQSFTVSGNQIMQQANKPLSHPQNKLNFYLNSLTQSDDLHEIMEDCQYTQGLIYGSGVGSNLQGVLENSITHGGAATAGAGVLTLPGFFEANNYPRSLVNFAAIVNDQYCTNIQGQVAQPMNEYYAAQITGNVDAYNQTAVVTNQYPLMPLNLTPSISIYHQQQSKFSFFRQRFLTYQVSSGLTEFSTAVANQAKGFRFTPGGVSGAPSQDHLKQIMPAPINCSIINGSITGSCISGNSNTIKDGMVISNASANCSPSELYTNVCIRLADTSIELNKKIPSISVLNLENTQVVMQYIINQPLQCLSSYLQPSFFPFPSGLATGVQQPADGTAFAAMQTQYKNFYNACLQQPGMKVQLTDVQLKVCYIEYPQQSYQIAKEIAYSPQPYYSVRQQIQPLVSGANYIRIASSGMSQICGVITFIQPTQPQLKTTANSADCMVNYFSLNAPGPGHLRYTTADSLYVPMSDAYVQIGSQRFQSNAPQVGRPALLTYLTYQDQVQQMFSKYLNIPFNQFVANRFYHAIAVDPYRSQTFSETQVVVYLNMDFTQREFVSKYYGEAVQSYVPQSYEAVSYLIGMASLVDCSYVRL